MKVYHWNQNCSKSRFCYVALKKNDLPKLPQISRGASIETSKDNNAVRMELESESKTKQSYWSAACRYAVFTRPCDHDRASTPTLIRYVVASLDKVLYDDYLCLVMALNKSKLNDKKPRKQPEKLGNGQLLFGCGFV